MTQFKTLFIFALFALMITGIVSRPSFLEQSQVASSVTDECKVPCGVGNCCKDTERCFLWKGYYYCYEP